MKIDEHRLDAHVTWTWEKLQAFKRVYAAHNSPVPFKFEGNLYVPEYANYLIEYLEGRFK
jgi:hypothetical protein